MICKLSKDEYRQSVVLPSELLQLWEDSVRSTHHFLSEEDVLFYKQLIPQYFTTVDLYIIRDEKEHIAAFMGLSNDTVEMLFVRPEEQGKGYGKQLLDYAIREKNIHKVDVNEQNGKVCNFYLRQGFSVASRDETDASDKPFPILHLQYPYATQSEEKQ